MKTLMLAMILLSSYVTGGSIYDFKAPGLLQEVRSIFQILKGKKILIRNPASKCGVFPHLDAVLTIRIFLPLKSEKLIVPPVSPGALKS